MIEGSLKLLAGMRLLLGNSALRKILWRMLGLLALLMIVLMGAVFSFTDYLAHLWLPEGDSWYLIMLSWLVWILASLLSILTAIISFTALGSAAIAPWLDSLATRTEALHGVNLAENQASWWQQSSTALMNSIRPLFILLAWGCLALALIWIPVIGQIAATIIWGYASIRFLCFELMDTTASRHGWNFSQRKNALNERYFFWLGFGGLAMALMVVPLLNLLIIPAAVVALSIPTKEH